MVWFEKESRKPAVESSLQSLQDGCSQRRRRSGLLSKEGTKYFIRYKPRGAIQVLLHSHPVRRLRSDMSGQFQDCRSNFDSFSL